MKLCAGMAATLGLSQNAVAKMATALTSPERPPVIWIGAQECTGCTESLLRATHPTIENLILNTISLEYHEVLSAAFGHQAEENKHNAIKRYKGKYVLVVDGSIPLKDGGVYCMVAGEPIVDHIRRAAADAAAVIAIGSCSAWGGVPASGGNPTGAVSLEEALGNIGTPIINIPGCPPNPHNFLTTVAYYITYGMLPALDSKKRPLFAYERLIHENCERRPHFDAGRFAKEFGDEGHRQGWCLYHLGSKVTTPVLCRQCEDKPCAMACPNNAIVSEDGCVKVIQARCIGCKSCVVACPYGAMSVVMKEVAPTADALFKRPQTKAQALKCDLCRHREAGPACVEVCPTQALRLVTPEILETLSRQKQLASVEAMASCLPGA